jgi:hypothetical protein
VKSVAAYALLEECVRQRKGLIDLRCRSVESGIETSDLRQFGIVGHCQLDRREIVRLVQRCQRHQSLELSQQFRSDPGRPGVAQPAMDHAVAERRKSPVAEPVSCPRQDGGQYLARHARRFRTEIRGRDGLALGPGGTRRRVGADPIDLPAEDPPLALVKTEFERRGAGVDHADQGLSRRRHAATLSLGTLPDSRDKFVPASEIRLPFIKNNCPFKSLRAQSNLARQRNSWRLAGDWQRKSADPFRVSIKPAYTAIVLPIWQRHGPRPHPRMW